MFIHSMPIFRAGRRIAIGLTLALAPLFAQAEVLDLPPAGEDLIGRLRYVKAAQGDTLIDIAHDHSVGQDEIVMANPNVSRWLPGEGTKVLIPDRYILPDAPRSGIVVNIPEMRLYFFPPGDGKNPPTQVVTYPISVGRMDWKSPMGVTKIVEKIKNPTWTPPESIKREHAAEGDFLPDVVPAGPDNPLGQFAMRLGVKGSYLIHGTGQDKADGIGMMVTHGCMRMYPEDVAELFPRVNVGTQVNLVYQSVKVGWRGNALYIEVSQPLDEDHLGYDKLLAQAMPLIQKKTVDHPDFVLNREALDKALQNPNGIPQVISGIGTAQPERVPVVPRIPVAPPPAPAPAPVTTSVPGTPSPTAPTPAPTTLPRPQTVSPVPAPVTPIPRPVYTVPAPTVAPTQPTVQAPPPAPVAPRPAPTPPEDAPPGPPVTPSSGKSEQQLLPPIY
jgi:L,D-transpeptidase ErfK/SrfK